MMNVDEALLFWARQLLGTQALTSLEAIDKHVHEKSSLSSTKVKLFVYKLRTLIELELKKGVPVKLQCNTQPEGLLMVAAYFASISTICPPFPQNTVMYIYDDVVKVDREGMMIEIVWSKGSRSGPVYF